MATVVLAVFVFVVVVVVVLFDNPRERRSVLQTK